MTRPRGAKEPGLELENGPGRPYAAEPPAELLPEHSLPHLLGTIATRTSRLLQKMYGERFGLSVIGWRLVAILSHHSPLSAKALAELTGMDQVSVTRAVDQLVAQRYVSRRGDSEDRRRVVLRLSKKGEDVYNDILPVLHAVDNALVAHLSLSEAHELRATLERVLVRSASVFGDDATWENILKDYYEGRSEAENASPKRRAGDRG